MELEKGVYMLSVSHSGQNYTVSEEMLNYDDEGKKIMYGLYVRAVVQELAHAMMTFPIQKYLGK